MSGFTLRVRQALPLRVDLRALTPAALAAAGDVSRLALPYGNGTLQLGELFDIAPRADDALVFEGDCSRCDRIGWQLAGGSIVVDGPAGHYAGALMTAGRVHVRGAAGDLAGCEMAGGTLEIDGDAGDFIASTLPGSMDGMRGGTLVVRGRAGERCADRMRRGTLLLHGGAGGFLASRLVAGTVVVGGPCGAHAGWGMRRGTLVFAGVDVQPPAHTFVESIDNADVAWQLIARDLARHGGALASLPGQRPRRWRGDLSAEGKGEWIVCR